VRKIGLLALILLMLFNFNTAKGVVKPMPDPQSIFANEIKPEEIKNGTIQLFIKQPVKHSRACMSLNVDPKDSIGYSFVKIVPDYGQPAFYANYCPAQQIMQFGKDGFMINFHDVPSVVYTEGEKIRTEGKDDWDVVLTYYITPEQAYKAIEYAKNYNKPFNIVHNNCISFALDIFRHIGIPEELIYIKPHNWTVPEDIEQACREKGLPVDAIKALLVNGFCPADAVEDLREANSSLVQFRR